ncbi:MAG TPA: hypothetical protein VK572_11605 [Burkholderiales bacterium]|nr:hypothetical protein [Burkholderiales bacterium]
MKSAFVFFLAVVALGVGVSTLIFVLPYPVSDTTDPERDVSPASGPNDVVSWGTLAQVRHRTVNGHVEHSFSKAISTLDNREVKLRGFLIPLDSGERHSHFLLSASPRSCFECWAAGPEGWVEVVTEVPVEDTYGQILVSGQFSVLRNDRDDLHYRIVDAVRVRN